MGFADSYAAGAGIVQRRRALAQRDRELDQQEAEQRQALKLQTTELRRDAVKTYESVLTDAIKAARETDVTTEAGRKQMVAIRESLELVGSHIARFDPSMSPIVGARLAQFDAAVANIQTPTEQARIKGEAAVAEAEAITKSGLTPAQRRQLAGVDIDAPKPQSPLGRLMYDRQLAARQFGENSPQVAAFDDAIEAGPEPADLSDVRGVRQEFTKLSGPFIDTQAAFGRIASSPDTAAGDVALVFNFMKMLDPGSVVREGEFALAAAAAGLPDRLVQLAERVDKGTRLTADQRADFRNVADAVYRQQLAEHRQRETVFRELAQRQGMNPDQVVIDFVSQRLDARNDSALRSGEASAASGGADHEAVPPAPLPRISSFSDYEALPPGSEFIWVEDGAETRARKPEAGSAPTGR